MPRKATVVEGVIEDLTALLRRRKYGAGSRLPGERDLARELGVSRPSLREALRTLERMGVLSTRHGSGTTVAETGAEVLRAPIEFLFMMEKPSVADLHETRALLEVHLAGRAAACRSDADLAELDAALRDLKAARGDAARTRADVRFHQAVAAASHNRVLERLVNCLRTPIEAMIAAALPARIVLDSPYESHLAVARPIREADAGAARRAMQEHMDGMTAELRQVGLLR